MASDDEAPEKPPESEADTASLAKVHAGANPHAYMWGSWNPTRLEADRQGNVKPSEGDGRDPVMEDVQRVARRVRALKPESRQAYLDAFLRLVYRDGK